MDTDFQNALLNVLGARSDNKLALRLGRADFCGRGYLLQRARKGGMPLVTEIGRAE